MNNIKKCCDCKQILSVIEFNKNKTKKDGLTTECKNCRKRRDAENLQKRIKRNLSNPLESIGGKICSRCRINKSLTEFTRDNSRADGFGHRCKPCQKEYHAEWRANNPKYQEYQDKYYQDNKEKINLRNNNYYQENKDWLLPKMNANRFFKKYGITQEEAKSLLDSQGGNCAICETEDPGIKGWCIDHCHDTGKVRGVVCGTCNSGMGLLKDNPKLLERAASYLRG